MEALNGPLEPEYPFDDPTQGGEYSEAQQAVDRHVGPDILPTEIAPEVAANDTPDPRTDRELMELVANNSQLLGEAVVGRIFEATKRFNQPRSIQGRDGTVTFEAFSGYKAVQERLPGFFNATAQAGVSPEDAETVLTQLLDSAEFPLQPMCEKIPEELTNMFSAVASREEQVTADDLTALRQLIDSYTSMSSLTTGPIFIIQDAHAAGLSLADSIALVQEHIDNGNSRQVSYGQAPLRQALEVLDIANADPALVRSIFTHITTVHAEDRSYTYELFKHAITMGVPALGLTADEMITHVMHDVSTGTHINDALDNVLDLDSRTVTAEVRSTQREKDKAFTHKPGELEHKALPYQTQRSLNDGLRDLEGMTDAWLGTSRVAEGAWIFDPQSNTWYSFGGETISRGDGDANHTSYLKYNVSDLSGQPLSLHIHPTAYALRPLAKMGFLFPSNSDYGYVADTLNQAEREINMRSFISHEHGITEFIYPNDPEAVQEVSSVFQEIRDRVIDDFFGSHAAFEAYIWNAGTEQAAVEFIAEVNSRMPEGFAIKLYPRGVDLEALIS